MATLLSPHFSLEELVVTSHRQFDNTPGPVQLANLKLLAMNQLEQVRALVGPMHVDSAYRSPAVNNAVGGAKTSQHVDGLACDWIPLKEGLSLKDAFELVMNSDIEVDQGIFEFGRWNHTSRSPEGRRPRHQFLMIGSWTSGKYLPYDSSKVPNL